MIPNLPWTLTCMGAMGVITRRGLSLAQQDFSRRNFVVHFAEAIGTLSSAAIPVASRDFANAVVYSMAGSCLDSAKPGPTIPWANSTCSTM